MPRNFLAAACAVLALLVLVSLASALASANRVPVSGADMVTFSINANALKPPECAALNLVEIIVVNGYYSADGDSSLILGSANADTIYAGKGTDCIIGGGSGDYLYGQNGNDVLLGGPGNDYIDGGGGTDVCWGQDGTDTFAHCETSYQ